MEFGPRDMKEKQAVLVRRDTGGKRVVGVDGLSGEVAAELETIQSSLFRKASEELANHTHEAATLAELKKVLEHHGGIVRVPWCGKAECEARMKEVTGGKVLNIPLVQGPRRSKCLVCSEDAASIALFGKSY